MKTTIVAELNPLANNETCDLCDAALYGALRITGERGVISITETARPSRNWISCDGCNALVCHACAPHFKTGYCEDCIREYELRFDSEGKLI